MQPRQPGSEEPIVYAIDGVEDLEYYQALLATAGATARHFTKPLEGLESFLSQPPSLLILDLDVAGPAAMAFLRLLRASPWHRSVPILACSSERATAERQQQAFEAGADGYLEKPFVEEEFLEAVNCLLEDANPPVPPAVEEPQAAFEPEIAAGSPTLPEPQFTDPEIPAADIALPSLPTVDIALPPIVTRPTEPATSPAAPSQ